MADESRRLSLDDVEFLQRFLNERFETHAKRFIEVEKSIADIDRLLHDRREGIIPQCDLMQERLLQFGKAFDRHCGTMRLAIRLLVGFCLTLLIALVLSISSESVSMWKHFLRAVPPTISSPQK